jgi:hypothetical protein
MTKAALALFASMLSLGIASAAGAAGYQKAYFSATKPGSWAEYTMKVEGQPDMGYLSTRLPDDTGQQRVEIKVDYMSEGKVTSAFTGYVLKPGYSLESDALGFGKALVSMSTRIPGSKAIPPRQAEGRDQRGIRQGRLAVRDAAHR